MSRHVIYSEEDFEPITVVEIPRGLLTIARAGGCLHLAAWPPITPASVLAPVEPDLTAYIVTLRPVPMAKPGDPTFGILFVTRQEAMAMLLDSVFLPGQRAELQRAEMNAYAKGALAGITLMGRFGR